jgi:hypothetical protein
MLYLYLAAMSVDWTGVKLLSFVRQGVEGLTVSLLLSSSMISPRMASSSSATGACKSKKQNFQKTQ